MKTIHPTATGIAIIRQVKRRLMLIVFLLAGVIACVLAIVWMAVCIVFSPSSQRGMHIAIAFDQLANATTGGDVDETITDRAARKSKQGIRWARLLCRFLNWLDPGHCHG